MLIDCFLLAQAENGGNGQNSPDDALVSWWPLQERWLASSFNVGYWSQQAEEWFQKRLALIKSGQARPLSNREWSKSLRPARRGFMEAHELVCATYM